MIKRLLLALVSACALLGAAAATSRAAAPARAKLVRLACHSTLDPTGRSVAVTSVMRHIAGTRTLSVKFSLLERTPGETTPETVGNNGDLGNWVTPSDPTLGRRADDVWKLRKSVLDVDAPAAYRFSVAFRWEGKGGKVLATDSEQTGVCHERELRPDVLVKRVLVRPGGHHGRRTRYIALIANRGLTASGPFSVVFNAGSGGTPKARRVASLAPGAQVRVQFTGPACDPASPPTVTADAADQVDDYDRSNNTLAVACTA